MAAMYGKPPASKGTPSQYLFFCGESPALNLFNDIATWPITPGGDYLLILEPENLNGFKLNSCTCSWMPKEIP